MKFQWYIINMSEATVEGTNDVDKARKFLTDEDYMILTGQHGVYFVGESDGEEVHELEEENVDEPDDESDDDDED